MPVDDRYKWIALSNTTLAMLLATIDASIMLIAMPAVFRGIRLDPLEPGNSFYLLWMILGFLVVSSVLVVSLGSLGDMYGRVRMYNLGFVIYTVASLILAVDPLHGGAGADWLIFFRLVQGVGAAFLLANTGAILTDAFPSNQRGLALGITNVVGISGTFIGLVLGGLLAPIDWRLIFLVSVPPGVIGTIWSYRRLREIGVRRTRVDRLGGQPHVRGRPRAGDGRDHLRHPAVRRQSDGLAVAVRARHALYRRRAARRLRRDRTAGRAADVRARAVQDPRLLGRDARDVPLVRSRAAG